VKCLYQIVDYNVYRFVMPVIASNMYVLIHGADALIVDPMVSREAEELLQDSGVEHCMVILTHEHFDHISGVNRLRELFACQVICTDKCAGRIVNPRKSGAYSFSALFLGHDEDQRETMDNIIDSEYACSADMSYSDSYRFQWEGLDIFLKEVHGHSLGSQIIHINDKYIFTGDNLVPGLRTVLRLPGGSRRVYESEVMPYLLSLDEGHIVFPGHGLPTPIAQIDIVNSI